MQLPQNPILTIPGVQTVLDAIDSQVIVSVMAHEKDGKSALTPTLFDWPEKGFRPLVYAIDATGPASCAGIGQPVEAIIVDRCIGNTFYEKCQSSISILEQAKVEGKLAKCSAIIGDCASTLTQKLLTEDFMLHPIKDDRGNYKNINKQVSQIYHRLQQLGTPALVWLGWVGDPETDGNGKVIGQARMLLDGRKNRSFFQGRPHTNLFLEKRIPNDVEKRSPGVVNSDGYLRVLHARPYGNVAAGGRAGHKLVNFQYLPSLPPGALPAHLGFVFDILTGRRSPPDWQRAQG